MKAVAERGGFFEVHHVRKLKDVKGKQGWEQIMIARKRKTMTVSSGESDLPACWKAL